MYCVTWSQYQLKCRSTCPFLLNSWFIPNLHWPMSLVFQLDKLHQLQLQQHHPLFWLDLLELDLLPNPSHLHVNRIKRHTQHSHQHSHHQHSNAFWPPQVALVLVAAGWAVWSRSCSYISSSSCCGTFSIFTCKGTAQSKNKSCHLLNYVTWIASTSGSSTSTGAGVGIAGGQHIVVTADIHWPNVEQAGRQNRSI